jgi:hypothetical protein
MMNRKQRRQDKSLPVSQSAQKRAYDLYRLTKRLLASEQIAYTRTEAQETLISKGLIYQVNGLLVLDEEKKSDAKKASDMLYVLYKLDRIK